MTSKFLKIILNISRSFAVPAFNFFIAIIGINYLGKENWGDFIQILLWIYFIAFISNFGNKDFLLRSFSENSSKMYTVFFENLFSRSIFLCLSLLLFVFFPSKIALLSILLCLLIFIYQSFESLIVFSQRFLLQLIAEILGFILIVSIIHFNNQINTETLISAYCIAFIIKITFMLFGLKINFRSTKFHFSKKQIYLLFPFFLITFSGWLASKIDLYIVNLYLSKVRIAEYQLFMTAFLMLQSFAALLIYPFSKHLYRLPLKSVKKIKNKIALIGIPLVFSGTISIWFVFENIVDLKLSTDLYILGGLSSLPIYFFIIDIMMFYRNKKEKIVMKINFISVMLKLILSLFLIVSFGLKGVLTSVLLTNYSILLLYKIKLFK